MSILHKAVMDAVKHRVALVRDHAVKDAESPSDAERASRRP